MARAVKRRTRGDDQPKGDNPKRVGVLYVAGDGTQLFVPTEQQRLFQKTRCSDSIGERESAADLWQGFAAKTLAKFRSATWFEAWFLRKEQPPENVAIAGAADVLKCRHAWDYLGLLRSLGMVHQTYFYWFRYLFPAEQLADWNAWLWGGALPAGVYLIPEKVEALRERFSDRGIAAAAAIPFSDVRAWRRDPKRAGALTAAVTKARNGSPGFAPTGDTHWESAAARKHPTTERMLEAMVRFAAEATYKKALSDTKIVQMSYSGYRTDARERVGEAAPGDLNTFVEGALPAEAGFVAPGLFLPTDALRRFRAAAASRARGLRHVRENLPDAGLQVWRLFWTVPRAWWKAAALDVDGSIVRLASPNKASAAGVNGAARQPVAESECVKLFGPAEPPIVNGSAKEALSQGEYDIVKTLIAAAAEGRRLTAQELVNRSGYAGARVTFDRLRVRDRDWRSVLLPSGAGRRGYGIK